MKKYLPSIVLLAIALVLFISFNLSGSTLDGDGVLHEGFWMLALGWFSMIGAAIYGFIRSLLSIKSGMNIYDKITLGVSLVFLSILAYNVVYNSLPAIYNTGGVVVDKPASNTSPIATTPNAGVANPASANCLNNGGRLVIAKMGNGGEYGLCYFDDNRACEEWAMYRGECPVGGRKTTGYDTIDQSFCAWSGGDTLAVPNSICTFKDGKTCPTVDFYNGVCSRQ
jgi:putative hemolysin